MTINKRTRQQQMLEHCLALHEDDGVAPKEFFRGKKRPRKQDRKTAQLCQQVAQTLGLVLSGEFEDEVLHNLQVLQVQPAPDASQLLVSVCYTESAAVDPQTVLGQLAKVSGKLRSEVAAAITRKKAPRLVFLVLAEH